MDIAALLAQVPDISPANVLGGNAGWAGVGMLGGMMVWLLYFHLPARDKQNADKDKQLLEQIAAKDAQIIKLLSMQESERDREREARHDRVKMFQAMHEKSLTTFLQTNENFCQTVKIVIEKQTLEFDKMINKLANEASPFQRKGEGG
jgi:hypothetical protein